MSAAFDTLRRAYDDRHGAAQTAGRPVVGIVGSAPIEPILAAGAFPVSLTPDRDRPTPTADHYIEPVVSPDVRALFEQAVAGELRFLDLLVISRANAKLYYYVKEIHRLGRAPDLPRLFMFDLMASRRDAVETYNRGRCRALVEAVERAVGRSVEPAALGEAIALTNRIRGLQRRLQAHRWRGVVAGPEALRAFGAGAFMEQATYADALSTYVAELEAAKPRTGVVRVLVSGSEPLTQPYLHEALESVGASAVAEDDAWGARAPGETDIAGGDPYEAVLAKAWHDSVTHDVYPRDVRQDWFARHVTRAEVDAVVFHIPPSDHTFGWDYPRLKSLAEAAGKPTVLLRQDASTAAAAASIGPVARAALAEAASHAA